MRWKRREGVYATVLFVTAAAALTLVTLATPQPLASVSSDAMLFFLLYGLFTISIGYHHPNLGYYSFDRVSQVASILVLGPIPAAWINGLASLLFPWHRLRTGTPIRDVCLASLHNSGLMALIVLSCGMLYTRLGGTVPLAAIDGGAIMLLLVLVLSMQALNDLGMFVMLKAGRRNTAGFFQSFAVALELSAGATAVLVAVVYNTMDVQLLVLLLGVLSLGMIALRQFGSMRLGLEQIIEERTESLRLKTLELEQLATQDILTGLFNRRYADAYLNQQLAQSDREHKQLSVALGDIDRFKQINDQHSHGVGDEVLRMVADTLRSRCRKTDMIARYGGEEFLICFPDTSLGQAQRLCNELRIAIEQQAWSRLGLKAGVTMSFGIAESRPTISASELVDDADNRLYAAKNTGRNRVVA
ncbi:MAG TPA: GGDEF domain-containing protein [Gammaproteobacteria bacterium]|nr:GGDEF domain-containing protein [Gammaproteobacteria bacterium]